MNIEIINNQKEIKINKKIIKNAAVKFLRHLKQRKDCILSITFASSGNIRKINKKYFNTTKITDVIAIEPGNADVIGDVYFGYLGDIIICPKKARENSKIFGTSLEKEILLYVAHGILHLLGYDDLGKKALVKMQNEQERLLSLL